MGESIITRAAGEADIKLKDSTYQSLGLDNTASMDDIITSLAYKSNDYATIICTVLNPDNTPAVSASVRMIDSGGININYTTDSEGKCIFRTNAGSANIIDEHGYCDLYTNKEKVDCPVGFTKFINLQRNTYGNGYNRGVFTGNGSVKFSNFINTIDLVVIGAGGQGGDVAGNYYGSWGLASRNENVGGGGAANKGNVVTNKFSPTSDVFYNINIGTAKIQTQSDSGYSTSQRWAAYAWVNFGSRSGYGATGGTTYFGNISAVGGTGGMNATSASGNFGLANGHANHYTGYSYGNGGNASHGVQVLITSYGTNVQGWMSNGASTYNYTASASMSRDIPAGNDGCVILTNLQYKV